MADIIHRIGIRAPAAKVYEAVATADGIAGWWTRETTASGGNGRMADVRFRDSGGKEIGRMEFEISKLGEFDPHEETRLLLATIMTLLLERTRG